MPAGEHRLLVTPGREFSGETEAMVRGVGFLLLDYRYGIAKGLNYQFPLALMVELGKDGTWVAFDGGIIGAGYSSSEEFLLFSRMAIAVRTAVTDRIAIDGEVSARQLFIEGDYRSMYVFGRIGALFDLGDRLGASLHLGSTEHVPRKGGPRSLAVWLGGFRTDGMTPPPTLAFRLTDNFDLTLIAGIRYVFDERRYTSSLGMGIDWRFD